MYTFDSIPRAQEEFGEGLDPKKERKNAMRYAIARAARKQ